MNCSTTVDVQNRQFLNGNFGASVFMTVYIGIYGLGIIVYFAWQFMRDARENHENEIPGAFFPTLHHINERQEVYNQLSNENWVREIYKIYYSDLPNNSALIEEKTNGCYKKYYTKMQNLKLRHTYYIIETRKPAALTTISSSQ
ncbi:unnamed protein product [Rotaria magnacalcarata]|uniref:Uncharacterized protein n=1 Tax=Rotaria magnacalcarata TaxID=392030 RepID=A0A817AEG5_9BILA|nr:unnamed protein product [Rotaria magnacalcarata]CAF1562465.1 unnamed protein product [Rotaria magnacalcarata]CAF2113970.1 unnamed protein product [Rotaria magnacalcarata]CAF2247396.1 unnamed protein product [Rotaria magnacalcarata]CAF2267349.1 unnamed protein product [Rotaria magnacalcarata]